MKYIVLIVFHNGFSRTDTLEERKTSNWREWVGGWMCVCVGVGVVYWGWAKVTAT